MLEISQDSDKMVEANDDGWTIPIEEIKVCSCFFFFIDILLYYVFLHQYSS